MSSKYQTSPKPKEYVYRPAEKKTPVKRVVTSAPAASSVVDDYSSSHAAKAIAKAKAKAAEAYAATEAAKKEEAAKVALKRGPSLVKATNVSTPEGSASPSQSKLVAILKANMAKRDDNGVHSPSSIPTYNRTASTSTRTNTDSTATTDNPEGTHSQRPSLKKQGSLWDSLASAAYETVRERSEKRHSGTAGAGTENPLDHAQTTEQQTAVVMKRIFFRKKPDLTFMRKLVAAAKAMEAQKEAEAKAQEETAGTNAPLQKVASVEGPVKEKQSVPPAEAAEAEATAAAAAQAEKDRVEREKAAEREKSERELAAQKAKAQAEKEKAERIEKEKAEKEKLEKEKAAAAARAAAAAKAEEAARVAAAAAQSTPKKSTSVAPGEVVSPLPKGVSLMPASPMSPGAAVGGVSASAEGGFTVRNSSAVLLSKLHLAVKHVPLQPLTDDQVLVEMKAVGICGSDVHYLYHGRCGNFLVEKPLVLGHESSGRVVALGKNVTNLQLGDRVAVEPGINCGACEPCRSGRYNLCLQMKFLATPPYNGSLGSYLAHPARLCHKIPPNLSYEEAAMCEPLSVALHAVSRLSKSLFNRSVLITGSGNIGMLVALVLKLHGVSSITLVDVNAARLKFAQELLGENDVVTVEIDKDATAEEARAKVKAAVTGEIDVAFECAGVDSSIALALSSVRSGGELVLIGMNGSGPALSSVPMASECLVREVDVKGVFRYANTYPTAIELISSGKLPQVKQLITHRVLARKGAVEPPADPSPPAVAPAGTPTKAARLLGTPVEEPIAPKELGTLDGEKLLRGFDAAKKGTSGGKDVVKVMFLL